MSATTPLPRIAITPGEPAGIGPDLVISLAQQAHAAELVAIADPVLLQARAAALKLPLQIRHYDAAAPAQASPAGTLTVLPVTLDNSVTAGQLDVRNAGYVLQTLERAAQGALQGEFAAIVTAPVQKSVINDARALDDSIKAFSGHTEFFQEKADSDRVVMMLACPGLRVALATTHLPLKDVPAAITQKLLHEVLTILVNDLRQKFGIAKPRIIVAGLNPHAGESGHLGREEIDVIIPTLHSFSDKNCTLTGPLPADTLFTPKYLEQADAVLAMYHDQGLPVLKYKGFGNAVNITLGLPFIRTSVDHGTALDLAGTGRADAGSLKAALARALEMINSRNPS